MPEKEIRKLINNNFMFKGRAEEAARLHPLAISRIPTANECIKSLKSWLRRKKDDADMRILSKKLEKTEKITMTPPMDKMELFDLYMEELKAS